MEYIESYQATTEREAAKAVLKISQYCKVTMLEDDDDKTKVTGFKVDWGDQILRRNEWVNLIYDRKNGILKDIVITKESL